MECIVIERPDLLLDLYERNLMAATMKDRFQNLRLMLETRYKYLRKLPLK